MIFLNESNLEIRVICKYNVFAKCYLQVANKIKSTYLLKVLRIITW